MNIQEIDKWLDNEYGVSYTRLEELHDFVVEQDFKHQEKKDKEIETLKQELQRKDNIINELKEICNIIIKEHNNGEYNVSTTQLAIQEHKENIQIILDKIKELENEKK